MSDGELRQFKILLSIFRDRFDSGQKRSFALAGEAKRSFNALTVTPSDEGKTYPANVNFDFNDATTWAEAVKLLAAVAVMELPNKAAAKLLCPTTFRSLLRFNGSTPYRGFRCEANATGSSLVMVDADGGLTYGEALERIQVEQIECVLYTTASNDAADNRFRVAVPLAGVVSPEEHKCAVEAVCRMLRPDWRPDTTKMNCFSLFYLPAPYAGAANRFDHVKGTVRSAEEWVQLYPAPEPAPRPEMPERREWKGAARSGTPSDSNEWNPEVCGAIDKYRGTYSDRHIALYGMMVSLAMSAINAGHEITASELADIADDE